MTTPARRTPPSPGHRLSASAGRALTGVAGRAAVAGVALVVPVMAAVAQDRPRAPQPSGVLDGPGFVKILLTTILAVAIVIVPSVMPSKRGHQD